MGKLRAFRSVVLREIAVVMSVQRMELSCASDDFVQLAPVEPHAPTFEAKVYFHAMSLSGLKGFFANWAQHS